MWYGRSSVCGISARLAARLVFVMCSRLCRECVVRSSKIINPTFIQIRIDGRQRAFPAGGPRVRVRPSPPFQESSFHRSKIMRGGEC